MPGQFINSGTNPFGNLKLTNTNNSGRLIMEGPPAPVLYLDASNSTSYSGTGTIWYDLSGNGNNVTMQNSSDISFSSGNGGYFSTGNTGYFSNTSTTGIPTSNIPYSINSWVQFPTGWPGGVNNHSIVSIGDQPTYNQINSFAATPSGYLAVGWFNVPGDPEPLVTSTWTPSSPGTDWMNVVSQWDGAIRSIWYNGIQQASDSVGAYLGNNTSILIGIDFPGFGNYLIGNIGLVQIYSVALTSTQIAANFNSQKTRFGV